MKYLFTSILKNIYSRDSRVYLNLTSSAYVNLLIVTMLSLITAIANGSVSEKIILANYICADANMPKAQVNLSLEREESYNSNSNMTIMKTSLNVAGIIFTLSDYDSNLTLSLERGDFEGLASGTVLNGDVHFNYPKTAIAVFYKGDAEDQISVFLLETQANINKSYLFTNCTKGT